MSAPLICQEQAASIAPTQFSTHNFPNFTLAHPGPLTIVWRNTDGSAVPPTLQDLSIWLSRASDGAQIAYQAGPTAMSATLTTATLAAGTYFVSVANYTFASVYTITLLITGPGCVAAATAGGSDGALIAVVAGAALVGAIWLGRNQQPRPARGNGARRPGFSRRRRTAWRR